MFVGQLGPVGQSPASQNLHAVVFIEVGTLSNAAPPFPCETIGPLTFVSSLIRSVRWREMQREGPNF